MVKWAGGGGYEIRTREGVNPTRFPSERHRPLGESSTRHHTGERTMTPIRHFGSSVPKVVGLVFDDERVLVIHAMRLRRATLERVRRAR